jgi:hypothetical protein
MFERSDDYVKPVLEARWRRKRCMTLPSRPLHAYRRRDAAASFDGCPVGALKRPLVQFAGSSAQPARCSSTLMEAVRGGYTYFVVCGLAALHPA